MLGQEEALSSALKSLKWSRLLSCIVYSSTYLSKIETVLIDTGVEMCGRERLQYAS